MPVAIRSLLLSFVFIFSSQTTLANSPHDTVQAATDSMLKTIAEGKTYYESDPQRFFSEVEVELDKVVDFKRLSRGVMAKFYRQASDEQKALFVEKFKTSLVKTYSKALVEFKNEKIELNEISDAEKAKAASGKKATVKMTLFTESGSQIPLQYSMRKNKQDEWRLTNVIVNGINLGLTFRNQFKTGMARYKSIDEVINNWTTEVDTAE